jgi:hypothetical protein
VHPRTLGDGTGRHSNDLAVAADWFPGVKLLQRHLMRLGDALAQGQPVGKLCARWQAVGINDDRNVVPRMDLNVERFHVVLVPAAQPAFLPPFMPDYFAGYVITKAKKDNWAVAT